MGGKILLLWSGLKDKWRTHSATAIGGRPKLLPSEQAALPFKYRRLRLDLKALARWLKGEDKNPTLRRVRERISDEAKRDRMRTLLFWPEFFVWIDKHGEEWGFLSGDWVPSDLAIEFLASDYAVGATTVRDLVQ